MNYMDSNEPYTRVGQKSYANDMLAGAAMGIGGIGSIHAGTGMVSRMSQAKSERNIAKIHQESNGQLDKEQRQRVEEIRQKRNGINMKTYNRGFGSGMRKGISYGIGAIGGTLAGGAISSLGD